MALWRKGWSGDGAWIRARTEYPRNIRKSAPIPLSARRSGHWPIQMQWPFWNPWDFTLVPDPPSSHSYSVVSERRAHLLHQTGPDPDSGTEPSTDPQDLELWVLVGTEGEEGLVPVQAAAASLEEAVLRMGSLMPQDDFSHQELLKRVASNLWLEVEVVSATTVWLTSWLQ